MVAIFFLQKDLTEKQLSLIEEEIKKSPLVEGVQFISSDLALEKFKKNFPELREILENLKSNPFPPSFETRLKDQASKPSEILNFLAEMKKRRGIEDVQFNREWVERMQSLSRLAKAIGFFLGGILILASFFIISNVIKLNVFARRNEIEILRLVGATNIFIRIPFLLEGMALGILGSLVSLALIFLLATLFPLYLGSSLGALQEVISLRHLSFSQCLQLLAGGVVIGFLGSLSSLSRFLRI